MQIRIGADPELFLQSRKSKEFVSGHDVIPGNKYNPFRVKKGAVQVDGTALEFNIDPAETSREFLENCVSVLDTLHLMVKKRRPDLKIMCQPTAYYDQAYFDSLPDEPKALGCQPDFDAYSGHMKTPPETKEPFRTGSGHVHVGWTEDADSSDPEHIAKCRDLVKTLDSSLFVMSNAWDEDTKRRTLYGMVGSFRPKHYGLEYRVLSNAWLTDPGLIEWVFNATKKSAELYFEQNYRLHSHSMAKDAVRKSDFTPDYLRTYETFLTDKGYPKLPESYV